MIASKVDVVPPAFMERRGPVAVITLNRPEVRNAVDDAMATAVGACLEAAATDPTVRAIIVTGAGDVSFCAGADLKAVAMGRKPFADGHPEWGFAGLVNHVVDQPLVAAVNGYALGGGTEIALACDLIVAAEDAKFGLPEVTLGIVAAAGGLVRLPQQVPLKVAMRAALTGEPISAEDAVRWGLVNELAAPGDVLDVALRLAGRIAANAPIAVQQSKRVVLQAVDGDRPAEALAWELTRRATEVTSASADAVEGRLAFIEKRSPVWRGA